MPPASGQLTYRLGLDSSGFTSMLKSVVGAVISYKAVMASVRQVGEAFRIGGELHDLGKQIGESAGNVLILQKTFEGAGIGAGSLLQMTSMMRNSLSGINEAGEKTENTFAALGLRMEDLRGLSAIQQFEAIGAAMAKLKTQEDKVAAARAIFGRGGSQMLGLFADPGAIDAVRQALGTMPAMMDKNAAAMDRIGDAWKLVKTSITGAFAGALAPALPLLDSIAAKLTAIDFTKIGINLSAGFKALGSVIGAIDFSKFASSLADVVLIALGSAVEEAFSIVWDITFWEGVGKMLLGGLQKLGEGLIDIFGKVLSYFHAGIQQIIDKLVSWLAKVPGLEDLGNRENKTFAQHYDEAQSEIGRYKEMLGIGGENHFLKDGLEMINGVLSAAGKNIAADIAASNAGKYFSGLGADFSAKFAAAQTEMMADMAVAPPAAGATEGVEGSGSGKAAGRGGGIYSDRWSKIGAFAGGSASGVGMEYAKQTAKATTMVERNTMRLTQLFQAFDGAVL